MITRGNNNVLQPTDTASAKQTDTLTSLSLPEAARSPLREPLLPELFEVQDKYPGTPPPLKPPNVPPLGPLTAAPVPAPAPTSTPFNEATAWPPPASILNGLSPDAVSAIDTYLTRFREIRGHAHVTAFRAVCDARVFKKEGETLRLEQEYQNTNAELRRLIDSRIGIESALAPFMERLELTRLPISDPEELTKLRRALSRFSFSYLTCPFERELRPGAQKGPDGQYPPGAYREVVTMGGLSAIRESLYESYRPRQPSSSTEGTVLGLIDAPYLALSKKRDLVRRTLIGAENRFLEYEYMPVAFSGVATITDLGTTLNIDGRAKPVEIHAHHIWHIDQPVNQNYIPAVKSAYDAANAEIEKARATLKLQLSAAGVPLERIPLVLRRADWTRGDPVESILYSARYARW